MSEKLSLLDNSSDSEVELTINKNYADRYDHWRNKEELQKYKDLKKQEEDNESSSSESEEEIPEFDEDFFRALSLLKGKDPRIYDKNFQLFQNQVTKPVKKSKVKKQKPIYMKDYERNLVLEKGGKFSDEEDEDNLPEKILTYDEEQENLKKSFKEALGNSDDSDCDADELLQVRTKTKKEEDEEEENYVKWLKGDENEVSEDVKKDMSYLRNYWNDPELDEGEKFLKDYILNKRYLEKEDSEIPTYDEITSGMLSDDEKMIEEQEKFEHKYNFRFEEPDEEFIKRYPRTIGDSLRRADNRRKLKREEIAERKRKEKEQRREELKRLKALKRKEIEEKFIKLKEISGQDEINLNESDIESDFDPDKHDQRMREMFNEEYYGVEENQKPEFPYDEELDAENWNAWAGEKIVDEEDEKDEKISDIEDNNESNQDELKVSRKDKFANEMINASRPKKKVKKKSLFAKIISQMKPIYDPSGKSFEEYLDEYYKLDYEDVVGDMPVRYRYRKVIPNDFGLTVDEILAADDKELNRWCSVKKTCQFRNDDEELYDVQAFQKKATNPILKKKILPSVYAPKDADDSVVDEEKCNEEINFDIPLKEVDDIGDSVHCSVKESIGQEVDENQGSILQVNGFKKKSNTLAIVNDNSDSSQVDDNGNKSNLKSSLSDVDDNRVNIAQSSKACKKSKKKKHKEKQNISAMKIESENSDIVNESANIDSDAHGNELSGIVENNSKSTKRKRKQSGVSLLDSKVADTDDVFLGLSPKSKQPHVSYSEDTTSLNCVSGSASNEPSKKKKKKKNKNKNKNKQNVSNDSVTKTQGNQSNPPRNKFKDKHKTYVSEDKRLGLSDERLAAYGINPKKFKNRILYSKK